jgi:Ca-activated chloride channel homolog
MTRRGLISTLPLLAGRLLRAQDATFSAGVNVVNLFATVRDRKGQVVRGLTKDDFLLEEDGKPQQIRYSRRRATCPLPSAC